MRVPERHSDLAVRRVTASRAAYVLAVSGILGAVTFALVYLTTLSLPQG